MDVMVLAAFLHVSFMWCVSDKLLSKLTPWSQTLSVRGSMTVLAKESFSILGVLVNLDVSSITSVSITFQYVLRVPSYYILYTTSQGSQR